MKIEIPLTVLCILFSAGAKAQTPIGPSPAQPALPSEESHVGTGTVERVDERGGSVRLRIEPMPAIGWGAKLASFVVADRRQLAALEPGERVRFELKPLANQYVISDIRVLR